MIKVAIITDGISLTKWQLDALKYAYDLLDVRLVLSCRNTKTKKAWVKNFFYFVLNFLTLRNEQTRNFKHEFQGVDVINFDSLYEGAWQKLPDCIVDRLKSENIDVVVKFGMSLLRIDGVLNDIDILSFHHGDPTEYRGRPAGFYELLHKKEKIGVIVQAITNKLDGGKVWAIGYSKVYQYSYKRTAIKFYKNSKFLLRSALLNYCQGTPVNIEAKGPSYKLPSNFLVLKFCFLLAIRKVRRIVYGAFYEKKWNVVFNSGFDFPGRVKLSVTDGLVPDLPKGYTFFADPFFSLDGETLRVEGMNSLSGLGEIIELSVPDLKLTSVILKDAHYSYPFCFEHNDSEILLPEVASHSSPYFLRPPYESEVRRIFFSGLENKRIVDSTLVRVDGVYYLFFGLSESAEDCLFVYYSDDLESEFKAHPKNPVVMDPGCARMAGRIVERNGRLYRFGQNNFYGYGDGIVIREILEISESEYREKSVGSIEFADASGPHTVDFCNDRAVLDFYVDKFSLLAGYRRLLPKVINKLK